MRPPMARLVAAALAVVVGAVAACAPEPQDRDRLAGLLVLTADASGAGVLRAWSTTDGETSARDLPVPGPATTWIAAGRAGVLAATLADGTLHISDPLDPRDASLEWREVEALDLTGEPPQGPFWFPVWDPEGGRFATLAGDLAGGSDLAVTLVDPTTATSFTIALGRSLLAAPPAWLDGDRVVAIGGSSAEPVALIVDGATSDLAAGPPGDRRIATSADAGRIAATGGRGQPVVVRDTAAWLAGDGTSIGSVDPPSDGATAASIALDRTGERLAIAWLTGSTVRVDVHDGAAGWRRVATETIDDGAEGAVVGWLR